MIKLFFFVFLGLFLVSCSSQDNLNNQTQVQEKSYDKVIVAYGDSLTEGLGVDREDAYPMQLEKELNNREYNVKVYNSGVSGETSTAALERVNWVLNLNPDIVILGVGANDAIRGIDLDLTKQNIREIVRKLKQENVTVILAGQIIFENLGEDYVNEFEDIYSTISREENVILIPEFLEGVAANSSLNNDDQIHPNKDGYEKIVTENVLPVLIPILNE